MVTIHIVDLDDNWESTYQFQPVVRICGLCQGDFVTIEVNGIPIAEEHADGSCVSFTFPEYETLEFYNGIWAYIKKTYGLGFIKRISGDPCRRNPTVIENWTNAAFTIAREGYWAVHMAHVCVPGKCVPPVLGGEDSLVVLPSYAPILHVKRTIFYTGEDCANTIVIHHKNTYIDIFRWRVTDIPRAELEYLHIPRATPAYVCVHRGSKKWCFRTPVWNGKVTVYY